jgi:hypothetical protein
MLTALGGGRSRTPGAPPFVNSIPARSNARWIASLMAR